MRKREGSQEADVDPPPPPSKRHLPAVLPDPYADNISNLPDDVLARILSFLDAAESVRTSALSRRWRYIWTLAPLDINAFLIWYDRVPVAQRSLSSAGAADGSTDNSGNDRYFCDSCWLVGIIESILSRHRGPIHGFHLPRSIHFCFCRPRSNLKCTVQTINLWIEILARRGIENLTLCYKVEPRLLPCQTLCTLKLIGCDLFDGEMPALPPNLSVLKLTAYALNNPSLGALPRAIVDCQSLCSLELSGYNLEEPFAMQLPPNLNQLALSGCFISDSLLSRVLTTCRLLHSLELDRCSGHENVRVNSSSLRELTLHIVDGYPWPVHLLIDDTPSLELLMLHDFFGKVATVRVIKASKLQSFGCVNPHLETLQLEDTCFQNGCLTKFCTRIYSLRALTVILDFDDTNQSKLLTALLSCFPCLESLDIEVSKDSVNFSLDEEYQEHDKLSNYLDHRLKQVKLKGFSGQASYLRFVRFLVRNAPTLRVISLNTKKEGVET